MRSSSGGAQGPSPRAERPAPQLKFFDPDQLSAEQARRERQATEPSGEPPPATSPRQKLRQFFENWYKPCVLKPKKARPSTIDKYLTALDWWEDVTGDPELEETTDELCVSFAEDLPNWYYRREAVPRGGKIARRAKSNTAADRQLSSMTVAGHVNTLARILGRTGPRFHPRKATADILGRCPFMPLLSADFSPKPPFDLAIARAIAAAASTFDKPDLPAWITPPQWWKARLAKFYFTGLRSGTIIRLRCRHLVEMAGQSWLDVPPELVLKTSKPIKLALHPQAASILRDLTKDRDPEELILPEGCCYRHLTELHDQLQTKAGLAVAERQSPHAWRRTHLNQMAELGADRGIEVARVAADHADGRTTKSSYVNEAFVNRLRLKLPDLWEKRLFD